MVTFAILGCGTIARTHAQALVSLSDDVDPTARAQLVACSDVVGERATALAQEVRASCEPGAAEVAARSWREILQADDIEAVSICTPSGTHAQLGIEALEAGKHVVVEKPMDVTVEAAQRLADAAARCGRTLSVISQHRFDRATSRAAALVAAGELGRLVLVDARVPWWRSQEYYDSQAWRGTVELDGGGALMNQGIHTVDLMLALAGPVSRVDAATAVLAHRIEVEDVVAATVRFASGALGTLAAATAVAPGFPARLALHGDAGSIVIEGDRITVDARRGESPEPMARPGEDALRVAGTGSRAVSTAEQVATGAGGPGAAAAAGSTPDPAAPGETAADEPGDPGEPEVWGAAHRRQLADVARAVALGREPAVTAADGLRAVELVTAVYRSAATGQGVRLG